MFTGRLCRTAEKLPIHRIFLVAHARFSSNYAACAWPTAGFGLVTLGKTLNLEVSQLWTPKATFHVSTFKPDFSFSSPLEDRSACAWRGPQPDGACRLGCRPQPAACPGAAPCGACLPQRGALTCRQMRRVPRDPLHNPLRPVIVRTRAVHCVVFLSNSWAIGCKKTPCGPSRSARHRRARVMQRIPKASRPPP